jgi:hypothetical protein
MSARPDTAFERLLGPSGDEVSCERCFELVDEYVELESVGIEAASLLPDLRAHLDGCSACNEDHESLRALLAQLAAEGKSACGSGRRS